MRRCGQSAAGPGGRQGRVEGGFMLIAVLVVVMLASMVAVSLLFRVRAEQAGVAAGWAAEQAWAAAWSGVERSLLLAQEAHADPVQWRHNPQMLRHQFVADDGAERWYFTVYSPPPPGGLNRRYGLTDEAARLNVNWAAAGMLQAGLGWEAPLIRLVTGETVGPVSVESGPSTAWADAAAPPAAEVPAPRRNPRQFATLEELLTLPGFTHGRLYGEDGNRNFQLDPNEDDGEESFPPDDADGQLFQGAHALLTVWSYDLNTDARGAERIRLNSRSTDWEASGLSSETVDFIHAFQASDVLLDHPAELLGLRLTASDGEGNPVERESPLTLRELPVVLDRFTAESGERLWGRINVNTAPASLLQALPGIDESLAAMIVQGRESVPVEARQSIAWLVQEELLGPETFKRLARWLTVNSLQFRFHVVGYGLPSGRYRVLEVVIDVAGRHPEVLYLRDITRLGLPFALPTDSDVADDEEPENQI